MKLPARLASFASFATLALLAAPALLAAGCSTPKASGTEACATDNAPHIPVTIDTDKGPLVIQAELADQPDTRMRGLMYRTCMGEQNGMIFLFPGEEQQSFWMRNTLIPLDMIFIRADHSILGIVENATPKTDTPRRVPGASQFVLEVNGGVSAKQGIRAGQHVDFYAPTPSQ